MLGAVNRSGRAGARRGRQLVACARQQLLRGPTQLQRPATDFAALTERGRTSGQGVPKPRQPAAPGAAADADACLPLKHAARMATRRRMPLLAATVLLVCLGGAAAQLTSAQKAVAVRAAHEAARAAKNAQASQPAPEQQTVAPKPALRPQQPARMPQPPTGPGYTGAQAAPPQRRHQLSAGLPRAGCTPTACTQGPPCRLQLALGCVV